MFFSPIIDYRLSEADLLIDINNESKQDLSCWIISMTILLFHVIWCIFICNWRFLKSFSIQFVSSVQGFSLL